MALDLPQGTKEYLLVTVTDALAGIASLTGTNPRYTVYDPSNVLKYTNAVASSTGMTAYCMIDTTTNGPWPAGNYELYLRLDALPEVPLLGPMNFTVSQVPE